MASQAPKKPGTSFEQEKAKAEGGLLQKAEVALGLAAPPKPKKASKPRIDALEGVRFCLIAYIASGHFIFTATSDPFYLKLIGQINVVVGAFFVISGYVAAYTTTELGERKYTAARLDNAVNFVVSRVMGFWPLHFLVLVLFSPMFFYADYAFSGPLIASHGFISTFLLSAWFPLSAEVWNAPTWFLSAMSFSFIPMPYALKAIAGQSKRELMRSLAILTLCSLLPKLAYSYDLQAWTIFEGVLNKKTHPNYALFNSLRFSPLNALLEILMGAVACRLVMLDTPEETGKTLGSIWPFMGMIGVIVLRAADVIHINDLLVRTVIFIPLFLWFLTAIHRETVGPEGSFKPIVKFMNLKFMQWLGGISFPIFIWHGPVGQLFYKKVVAKQVWGGSLATIIPGHFAVWWLTVIILSWLSMKFFVNADCVKQGTKKMSAQLEKPLMDPPASSPA